jgi:uncharacterized RDD family membrane protein YckC
MMNQPKFAGFWIRTGATLIDVVVVTAVIAAPLTYIYGADYWLGTSTQLVHGGWDIVISYVLPIIATVWFWLKYRATPGKLLTGIEIVDANTGSTMSLGQAFGRYFAYILALLPLGLGLIWVAFDKNKQGWHDKLARTYVLHEK